MKGRIEMRLRTLLAKEWRLESRSRERLLTSAFFALLLVIIGSFCFPEGGLEWHLLLPGLYWLAYLFAGTLFLGRSFQNQEEWSTLQRLLLSGVPAETMLLGKSLVNWCGLTLLGGLLLPCIGLFYNYEIWAHLPALLGITALAGAGFSVLGTFCAAMTRGDSARQAWMPLLFFPLVLPLALSALQASSEVLMGDLTGGGALRLLMVCDLLYSGAAWLLFAAVVEE